MERTGLKRPKYKYQTIHESSLYEVRSRKHLEFLLRHDLQLLRKLVALPPEERYRIRPNTGSDGKVRWVQVPRGALKHVHRRIYCLLNRLITPNYLHSGKRGCSYVTNAEEHVGARSIFKIDVSRFFENVLWKDVFAFFRHALKCSPDVSALLANLCTVERRERPENDPRKRDRHLPTGSPISQCLAYWCFAKMFDSIAGLAHARNLKLTVYVDDITLSGLKVSRTTQVQVRRIIESHGLVGHKERLYRNRGLVTGTIVTSHGLKLPNSRRQQIMAGIVRLKTCRRLKYRVLHLRKLVGQLWAAVELDRGLRKYADEYTAHLQELYRKHPEYKPRQRKAAVPRRGKPSEQMRTLAAVARPGEA